MKTIKATAVNKEFTSESLSISVLYKFVCTNSLCAEYLSAQKHFDKSVLSDLKSFINYIALHNPDAMKIDRKLNKSELQKIITEKYEILNTELERQNSELCADITGIVTTLKGEIAILQNGIDGVSNVVISEKRTKWSFSIFAKAINNDAKTKKQAQKA